MVKRNADAVLGTVTVKRLSKMFRSPGGFCERIGAPNSTTAIKSIQEIVCRNHFEHVRGLVVWKLQGDELDGVRLHDLLKLTGFPVSKYSSKDFLNPSYWLRDTITAVIESGLCVIVCNIEDSTVQLQCVFQALVDDFCFRRRRNEVPKLAAGLIVLDTCKTRVLSSYSAPLYGRFLREINFV